MVVDSLLRCLVILGQMRTSVSAKKDPIKHYGYEVKIGGVLFGLPEKIVKKFGCNVTSPMGFVIPSQDITIEDGCGRCLVVEIDRFFVPP